MSDRRQSIVSTDPIRIGVSACLLGREVRFDGQHKRDSFLVDELGPFVEFVPVCPEVEVGMPIPRETLRLVRGDAGSAPSHLVGTSSGEDWTSRMTEFSRRRVKQLARLDLSGYVLKKDSPSCGLLRVKRYPAPDAGALSTEGSNGKGTATKAPPPQRDGQGLFAAQLQEQLPHLPIEEEGRLCDPRLRENFIERVFAYRRLQTLWRTRWTQRTLIDFHTAHKMALLAHDEAGYRQLGRLVAHGKSLPREELRYRYESGFMTALNKLATPGRQVNVLTHMLGHFSEQLEATARTEILEVIEDHRRGIVPLIVPLTLIRHYVRLLKVEYLSGQTYLDPHPRELMLRNRV
jgi:uncharacterized protein YbgA (DUF1722 family)/uncharacterized protein YbbK (DUF523 family)